MAEGKFPLRFEKGNFNPEQKTKSKGEPCEDWFYCEDYDELGDIACFLCMHEGCEHDEDCEEVGV